MDIRLVHRTGEKTLSASIASFSRAYPNKRHGTCVIFRVKNPTVNFADIQMMYVIDPIGSPYNASSNILMAFGGEQVSYNQTSGLNEFLDEVWPSNTTVQLLKGPRAAVDGGGSSMDTVTNLHYSKLCGNNCLADGGVPALWIFQPSFQKYRTSSEKLTCNTL